MSTLTMTALACDAPGCDQRLVGYGIDAARKLAAARDWTRAWELSSGILLFRDYCPEHEILPTAVCRRGHAVVFEPSPWALNQRRPKLCPACGEELTP